jgi:hypothetical protein
MKSVERTLLAGPAPRGLAHLTLAAGVGGMAVSFFFLASASRLDVLAGTAGFIAGAILVAAGLLALSALSGSPAAAAATKAAADFAPPRLVHRWLAYFRRNREGRPEPDWHAPIMLSPEVVRPLVASLEQFQLGDGGGPASLIARDAGKLRAASAGARDLERAWFAEEREHARLLGAAVARFGGRCIHGHWSFTAFCLTRRWLGVRFELTVLLLTEIVSTAYYRLLRRHGEDPALRAMCKLILRDEAGHVAFHRDRLAEAAGAGGSRYGKLWEARFRALGWAAATMLWVNHAPALRAVGGSRSEFYREVGLELSRFVLRLRREARAEATLAPQAAPYAAVGAVCGA